MKRLITRILQRLFWRQLFNVPEERDGQIETIAGWRYKTDLRQRNIRSKAPCGYVCAKEYFIGDTLVRRDEHIVVIRGIAISAEQAK